MQHSSKPAEMLELSVMTGEGLKMVQESEDPTMAAIRAIKDNVTILCVDG